MSVLVVQIPPRRRTGPRQPGADDAATVPPAATAERIWATTSDGSAVQAQGRSAVALMPRADSVVAVLSECDVAWQTVTLPKAPAAKLRAALAGVVEDQLLDEPEALHLALAPGATPGAPTWIAVTDRAWLAAEIDALERGGMLVDRVVPSVWPDDTPHGHFLDIAADGATPVAALAFGDAQGAACVPLAGSLPRTVLPTGAAAARWPAAAAVAAAAERWLGAPVTVQSAGERLVAATRSPWNLRQFDLAPRRRGVRALRDAAQRLMSPAWRPVRVGLVALAALQVVGLNAWAWTQRQAVESRRAAQHALIQQVHPQVRTIVDAPLQMERENERLRVQAGRPGPGDLESMMAVAAAAWPDPQGPAQSLRYQAGQLTVAIAGWGDADRQRFAERLRVAGYAAESSPTTVTITPAAAPPAR